MVQWEGLRGCTEQCQSGASHPTRNIFQGGYGGSEILVSPEDEKREVEVIVVVELHQAGPTPRSP